MKKSGAVVALSIVGGLIIAIAVIVFSIFAIKKVLDVRDTGRGKSELVYETEDDMLNIIDKIYEKTNDERFGIECAVVDVQDEFTVKAFTGLDSTKSIDKIVTSQSMIMSTPYSLALVKVKDGEDVEAIKKEMVDNIDMRRWICVGADVVYATNVDNLIFIVMAEEQQAKSEYKAFKELANNDIGEELSREAEELNFEAEELRFNPDEIVVEQE